MCVAEIRVVCSNSVPRADLYHCCFFKGTFFYHVESTGAGRGGGPARFPHFSTRGEGVGSQFHVDKCSASCLRFIIFAPITKLLFVMFRAI